MLIEQAYEMTKSILLIGGTGFLGRNISDALFNSGFKLVVLTRDKKQAVNSFPNYCDQMEFIEAKLSDYGQVKRGIQHFNVEVVIHLASGLIPGSDEDDYSTELTDIVFPTFKLLSFLAQKKIKIIFISSAGTVYGNHKKLITESTELKPVNYYGFSKLLIEQNILLLSRIEELIYVIVRPSNVYGKSGLITTQQGFVEIAIEKMLDGKPLEIWGSGNQTRDFIHVSSLCSAVNEIVTRNIRKEIFNVALGESYSLLQIVEVLERILNVKASLAFYDKRKVDVENISFDISYIKAAINYNPLGLIDGIRTMLSNYNK